MNLSLNKIKQYNIDVTSGKLDDMLTQLGHEVETVENLYIENLVIGKVIEVVKHPDADKLNIAKVDVKDQILQIVCGAPNLEVNKKVIVALIGAKLGDITISKATLKGIESNGMLCSLAELGLNKSVLNSKDIDGICLLDDDAIVGNDACDYLGINDEILDVSLTADRGDCQNYQGVINDLAALVKYQDNKFKVLKGSFDTKLESSIDNKFEINCDVAETKYFSHVLIENIKVIESDLQTQISLMKNNIKPQNNIVDALNLAMIEFGLPMHSYDADKVNGKLVVKVLDKEEKFIALDEKEYQLVKGTQVICDDEKIVAIAGVIGSNETKITNDTVNVLLESAIFDPFLVRTSAKNIFKKTDASIRFEKGVDQSRLQDSMNYVINRICKNNDIKISNKKEISNLNTEKKELTINFDSIRNVLGIEISDEEITTILENLNFIVSGDIIKIPFARHDINYQNDIAEEIIRIFSIDNVEVEESYKTINLTNKLNSVNELTVRRIEDILLGLSLDQVITYSLVSKDDVNCFTDNKEHAVELMHPISNEKSVYRKSLVKSLLDTAFYNFNRMQNESRIFEIGDIYFEKENHIVQETKITGLLSGVKENYYQGSKRKYDFFDLKRIIQNLFDDIRLDAHFVPLTREIDELNPYASADIIVDGKSIGYIGQVHINLIKKHKYPVFVFEIDYKAVYEAANKLNTYNKLNEYPSIERDLTLNGDKELKLNVFTELFTNVKYLEEVTLMDIFFKEESKAVTYKLVFTNSEKTLTSQEIDEQINNIIEKAKDKNITL